MKKAAAIRHVHFEDLGVFEPVLTGLGFGIEYFDAATDDLSPLLQEPPDLLVVLGGPIGAFDEALYPFLEAELKLIRQRLDRRLPLVGICLGAQLIARALGAKVGPMGHKEIGYSPLTLSAAGQDSCLSAIRDVPVLHWHGDQFGIPEEATLLAGSGLCPHQAFAVGDAVLGLQFHPEADERRIEHWLIGHAAELSAAGIDPSEIRRQAQQYGPALRQAAPAMLRQWLGQNFG